MKFFSSVMVVVAMALVGCGGSGTSNTGSIPAQVDNSPSLKGYVVDSPVSGMEYVIDGVTALTESDGGFYYTQGDVVTFKVGAIEFGQIPGQGLVTPLDWFNTSDASDVRVVNALRLLQTLDSDGDPSNGIAIESEAIDEASEIINFASSTFDADVLAYVGSVSNAPLVGAQAASDHFSDTLANMTDVLSITSAELVGNYFDMTFVNADSRIEFYFGDNGYVESEGISPFESGSWTLTDGVLDIRIVRLGKGSEGDFLYPPLEYRITKSYDVDGEVVFVVSHPDGYEITYSSYRFAAQ